MYTALKFNLLGDYGFFKNPECNQGINKNEEYSFKHIHKPTLLGIIGAILGMNGKRVTTKKNSIPEYYQKLKDTKISIVPEKPVFYKFKETIVNTTGFANDSNTQVIRRKILQNPQWTIYILKDSMKEQYWNKLCNLLQKHESTYPIYLGNNVYPAKINNVEVIELSQQIDKEYITINSIYKEDIISQDYKITENDTIRPYFIEMYFPDSLNEMNLYEYDWYRYSNLLIDVKNNNDLYNYSNNILYFL